MEVIPPASVRPGFGADIKTLILQKERELHDINEYRIRALEELCQKKDAELEDMRLKFSQIKEDFQFNLDLIQQRDEELDSCETELAKSKQSESGLLAETEQLRAQLANSKAAHEADRIKLAETQAWYKQHLDTLQEQIASSNSARADEKRSWSSALESARTEAHARVRAMEVETEQKLAEMHEAAEAAMMQSQRESKKREEKAMLALQAAEARAAEASTAASDARREVAILSAALEGSRAAARQAEADASQARTSLDTARAAFESRLASVERERDIAVSGRASLLEEYETRMTELLASLKQVEGAFKEQKREFEAKLAELTAKSSADMRLHASEWSAKESDLQCRLRDTQQEVRVVTAREREATQQVQELQQRLTRAERLLSERDVELHSTREELASISVRTSTQLASAHARLHEAIDTGIGGQGVTVQIRADLAAALTRAEKAESQLRSIDSNWEARWSGREGELREAHSKEVMALQQHIDRLTRQIQGHNQQTKASSSAVNTSLSGEDTTLGIPPTGSQDPAMLLQQLETLERELQQARQEARAAEHALTEAADEDNPVILSLRMELSAARAEAAGHAAGEDKLRAVVAEMREHIEELQEAYKHVQEQLQGETQARIAEQAETAIPSAPAPLSAPAPMALADALAYKATAETMLASLKKERDDVQADLGKAQAYIRVLQARSRVTADAEADSEGQAPSVLADADIRTECSLLREQLHDEQDAVASLRIRLREYEARVALHEGRDELRTQYEEEVEALQGRVEELVEEREKLLELSNSLRGQLLRMQAASGPASHATSASPRPRPEIPLVDASTLQRVGYLEATLARVTGQNAALQQDMQRLLIAMDRQGKLASQATANVEAPLIPATRQPAEEASQHGRVDSLVVAAQGPEKSTNMKDKAVDLSSSSNPWSMGVVGSAAPTAQGRVKGTSRPSTAAASIGRVTAAKKQSTSAQDSKSKPVGAGGSSIQAPSQTVGAAVRSVVEAKAAQAGLMGGKAGTAGGAPAWLKPS